MMNLKLMSPVVLVWAFMADNPAKGALSADFEIYDTVGGAFDGTPFSGIPSLAGSGTATASGLFPGYDGISLSPLGETDLFYFPFPVYSARMTGAFVAPDAGVYSFGTYSDDGSTLYVDGNLVVNNGGAHGPISIFQNAALTAGPHTFSVNFYEDFGGEANLTAYFDPILVPVPEPFSTTLVSFVVSLAALGRFRRRREEHMH